MEGRLLWWTIGTGGGSPPPSFISGGAQALASSVRRKEAQAARSAARTFHPVCEIEEKCVSYSLRDVGEGMMLLVREELDRQEGRIVSESVGTVENRSDGLAFDPGAGYRYYANEVDGVVQRMRAAIVIDAQRTIGSTAASRAVAAWCRDRGGVLMRSAGGVYFMPESDGLQQELVQVDAWLSAGGGELWYVSILAGDRVAREWQNRMQDALESFADAASVRLSSYLTTPAMNRGSLLWSTQQLQRGIIDQIERSTEFGLLHGRHMDALQRALSQTRAILGGSR